MSPLLLQNGYIADPTPNTRLRQPFSLGAGRSFRLSATADTRAKRDTCMKKSGWKKETKGRKEGRKTVVFVHVPMCRRCGTKPVLLMCEGRNWKERSMLNSDQSFVRLSPLYSCPFLAANRGRARYNFGSKLFTAVPLLASVLVLVKICPFGFLLYVLFSFLFSFLCLYLPSAMCSL